MKKVKKLKNEARRELRQAKRESIPPDSISSLAQKFFELVREHSRLKRASNSSQKQDQVRKARRQCYRHFWKFEKQLLDDKPSNHVMPQFFQDQASSYFAQVYHAETRNFDHPQWLPATARPDLEFDYKAIATEEIQVAIKRSKALSTPSPLDQISYQILKRCPSLQDALLDLYNCCWQQTVVPSQWKMAAIKLIPTSSAVGDPDSPGNFRPIALTPCIGKLFTTILRNRWLNHMNSNGYFNRDIQKAFMPTTPGCTEHHSKLAAILSEARRKHKSLAICWLDLANAYGSVHHSLIQFAIQHYHAPPQFQKINASFYSGLAGQILTTNWSTPSIPLKIGVYQGDPLSVVIFNTVPNTLVDTLQTRLDLGYSLSTSNHQVNLLQYADDTCITANSAASAQHLLNMTSNWLEWAGMKAKPSKCHSLALAGSTGKLFNPNLQVSQEKIPYVRDNTIRFLGLNIKIPANSQDARDTLASNLHRMLQAVDACPLTRLQKLHLYRAGICPPPSELAANG